MAAHQFAHRKTLIEPKWGGCPPFCPPLNR